MEKIFYVNGESNEMFINSTLKEINAFIKNGGTIISVTPNNIHNNTRGSWLVVAEGHKNDEDGGLAV